jgi:addiction module HigA family antidote
MLRSPLEPAPLSPGEVLREDYLAGTGITQDALAAALGVSRVTVNMILNDRRTVTAEMALRLARVLGTTPDYWLRLQAETDLHRARRRHGAEIGQLSVLLEREGPKKVSLDDLLSAGARQDDV